jgi:hypothetical protein
MSPVGPDTVDSTELRQLFHDAIHAIELNERRVRDRYQELVGTVDRYWIVLGPEAGAWVTDLLRRVGDLISTILDRATEVLTHATPVIALFTTGLDWLDAVKAPVTDIRGVVDVPVDDNMASWSGTAAKAYNDKLVHQKDALDQAAANADFISTWLVTIGQGNIAYMGALAHVLNQVAGKLGAALAGTVEVVTIPWALAQLDDELGDLITAGLDHLVDAAKGLADDVAHVRDAKAQTYDDRGKFPGGQWPVAVRV